MFYKVPGVLPEEVVCPSARHLTPAMTGACRLRHPRNAAHLLWPEREGTEGVTLESWRREGTITKDPEPAFYVLSQSFRNSLGIPVQRLGLIGLCKLREFSAGEIIPHQKTLPAFLEESVRRLQHLNAHLQPVCLLAADPDRLLERSLRQITAGTPLLDFLFDDVIIRLWRASEPDWIRQMRDLFAGKSLLLAAGHHSYEAALTYRDMMRLRSRSETTPCDFIPALVTGMYEETIVLRPVFRVVRTDGTPDWEGFLQRLSKYFRVTPLGSLVELAQLPEGNERHVFGIVGKDRLLLARWDGSAPLEEISDAAATPEVRDLDISILHHFILGRCLGLNEVLQQRLEHVGYARDIPEAVGVVQRNEAAMAFVTPQLDLDQMRRLMRSNGVLPPLTTALFPAIPCGSIIHRLDEVVA